VEIPEDTLRNELLNLLGFTEAFLESLVDGLIVLDTSGRIVLVNKAFCRITGFEEKELLESGIPYPFWPPEYHEEFGDGLKKNLGEDFKGEFATIHTRKDGERFSVAISTSAIRNSEGKVISHLGLMQDLTLKSAEPPLKDNHFGFFTTLHYRRQYLERILDNIGDPIFMKDQESHLLLVNDAFCAAFGLKKSEIIGKTLAEDVSPEERESFLKIDREVLNSGVENVNEETLTVRGGDTRIISTKKSRFTDEAGNHFLIGIIRDITERKRAEQALEDRARRSEIKKDAILKLAGMAQDDLQETFRRITKLAAQTLELERVSIWKFTNSGNEILCEALYIENEGQHRRGDRLTRADCPNYFKLLEQQKSVLVPNAQEDPATADFGPGYLKPNGIKSLMDVFVYSAHQPYGILCFEHVGPGIRSWTAEDLEFASSMANVVSLMVESNERKKAEEQIRQANLELSKANKELDALRKRLEQENMYLRNELDLAFNYQEMVYSSQAISQVLTEVEQVAATNATVLLQGESGTGKELLARAIHNISPRSGKPMIKVNCAAIPGELLESELFGHKKGAFTGAVSNKVGKFELADGGTLFLDEIGELPLEMQPKLLRFLQEGEIEVVGGTEVRKLDVRIIAATNRYLKEEVEKGDFREDLYFRINVFPIEVPPLRERKEDIPILVEHFMDKFNRKYGKNISFVTEEAMSQLKQYEWPGNIRELENLLERATIVSQGETLVIPGFESQSQKSKMPLRNNNLSLTTVQRNHILHVLDMCDWKITGQGGAAELLDMRPSTLRDRMQKLGIERPG